MRTDRSSRFRRRFLAFCAATLFAVVLWLLAVLAVGVLVRPASQLFPEPFQQPLGGIVLWPANGNPANAGAWHTLVQIALLVVLATLVAAGIDRLQRALRRSPRRGPAAARNKAANTK